MKTFLRIFGACAVAIGLLTMAGSAGDCDGRCMEEANDIATMIMLAGYGMVAFIGGCGCLWVSEKL